MRRIWLAALAAGMIGQTAMAAELDGCDLTAQDYAPIVAPMLDGAWTVHNGPGLMMMKMGAQEMKMPLPPMGSEIMAMLYRDGEVYADMSHFGEALVSVAGADSQIAQVPIDGAQRDMDFDALGEAPNCMSDVMLRLEFSGDTVDSDGNSMWTHVHLAVLDENRMSGVMVMQGHGPDGSEAHARRLLTFLRVQ